MTFPFRNLELYRALPRPLVVNLSGGQSSAYSAAHYIVAHNGQLPDDVILAFENTSEEHELTYEFLWQFENYFGVPVTYLERDITSPTKVRVTDFWSCLRDGEIFDELFNTPLKRRDGTVGVRPMPNPAQRVCTAEMKTKTVHRYVRKHLGWPTGYYSLIGFRHDEQRRIKKRKKLDAKKGKGNESGIGVFPMDDGKVVSADIDNFWFRGPFRLKLDRDFTNCFFCFMAATWRIKARMMLIALEDGIKVRPGAEPPARVARWIAREERVSDRPGPFRRDRPTLRQLWEQVCNGDMASAVANEKDDKCGACHD